MATDKVFAGLWLDKGGAVFNVKHPAYGAVGDGVADDTAAIEAAAADAADGVLFFPPGTYLHDDLVFEDIPEIRGCGVRSILKPSAGITTGVTLNTVNDATGMPPEMRMRDIVIDGSLTTGKKGLLVGGNALSARIMLENVRSQYFAGSGGLALHVSDCVQPMFDNCRFTRSHINVLIEAADGALPTLPAFRNCYINHATTKGLKITNAWLPKFERCVFEANLEEGVLIDPAAADTVLKAIFEDCWFELNYFEHGSATSNYSFVADGTGATCQPHLIRCYFSSTALTEKAARFIACTDIEINSPFLNNVAGLISVDANCRGHVVNWDENMGDMLSLIANASPNLHGLTNRRQAQVLTSTTSIAVTHGLGTTPPIAKIRVLPENGMGDATHYWISNVTSTQFTINVDQDPTTGGAVFNWEITL